MYAFQPVTLIAAWCSLNIFKAHAQDGNAFLAPLPPGFPTRSTVLLKHNLAVIPGEWEIDSPISYLTDIRTADPDLVESLEAINAASFIAWDPTFLDLVGHDAKVERIQSFSEPEDKHVHEAPVFLPETNELLYSDTSKVGLLFAINIDTFDVRELKTNPPLRNVNGGTYHDGQVYVVENGGHARGLWRLNATTGEAECLLNNFRGRHLNSPNDLIFDSNGDIYFTDPHYGAVANWPGAGIPELPNAIYHFNTRTRALTPLSNALIPMPNGLALSADERTLYIANSNSSFLDHASSTRDVYAFDLATHNARLIYQCEAGWPDGLRVSARGYVFIAVANGVDVVDPGTGLLVGKVNVPGDIIFNLEPAISRPGTWLLTGAKGIYKVRMAEAGKNGEGRGGGLDDLVEVVWRRAAAVWAVVLAWLV